MLTYLIPAFVIALVGSIPQAVHEWREEQTLIETGIIAAFGFVVTLGTLYVLAVTFVWPLWGAPALIVFIWWVLWAGTHFLSLEYREPYLLYPLALALVIGVRALAGWGAFNAEEYAALVGKIESRVWEADEQPADPRHVRLVPRELAMYRARKALGEAGGAIGSRFTLSEQHATLQKVRGELWYIIPLDYADFLVWTDAKATPGYVEVHGEDPTGPVRVQTNQQFVYTPGAYWYENLERHLRANGYLARGLTDYSLELDEDGKPWWVVTVFRPTIAWWGPVVDGVVIVHPTTGVGEFHALGAVPAWVDRVVPSTFVAEYLAAHGTLKGGWKNTWKGKVDLMEPEQPDIVYGSDGEPYWVTGITSTSGHDDALVAVVYTHTRTGVSRWYRASGATDAAVVAAVNSSVSNFDGWRATSGVLYNVYGTMAAIVPVLGKNDMLQRVAIVRVDNQRVALAKDVAGAFVEYRKLLTTDGQQVAVDAASDAASLTGTIDRIAGEVRDGQTVFSFTVEGQLHIFTGSSGISVELPLAQPGDTVQIGYIASDADVIPLLTFDDVDIVTVAAPAVRERKVIRDGGIPATPHSPLQ